MATADFTIKQGDTAPPLSDTLLDSSNLPVDLTGVQGVRLHIKTSDLSTTVVDAAAVVDQTGIAPSFVKKGQVHYNWQAADVASSGAFWYEWEVTWADGSTETFPNWKNLLLKIVPALVAP